MRSFSQSRRADFASIACDSSCASCAGSPTFCLTCSQSGQFALNGSCIASCPANTFSLATAVTSNNSTASTTTPATGGTCSPCHPDCATCTGPRFDQCASCPVNRPVRGSTGRCLQACSRGEYWDVPSGSCIKCSTGCATCSGSGADACLSCATGMLLTSGQCNAQSCPSTGSVDALGSICLSTLVSVVVPKSSSSTTLKSIWPFILGAGILLLLLVLALFLWRRHARKRRAAETKLFKERLERDGLGARAKRGTKFFSRMFGFGEGDRDRDRQLDAEKRRTNLLVKLRLSRNPANITSFDLENTAVAKPKFKSSPRPTVLNLERMPPKGRSMDSDTDDEEQRPETPFRRPTHKYADSTDTTSTRRRDGPEYSRETLVRMLGELEKKPESRAGSRMSTYTSASSTLPAPRLPEPKQPLKSSEYEFSVMQGNEARPFDSRYPPAPTQPLIDLQSKPKFGGQAVPVASNVYTWQSPKTLPRAPTGSSSWLTPNSTGTTIPGRPNQRLGEEWQTSQPTGSTTAGRPLFYVQTLPPGTSPLLVTVPTGSSTASGSNYSGTNPFREGKI